MKRGTLVKYVGDTVPTLKNRCGRFVRTDRKGWDLVDFGEGHGVLRCAVCNIERIESVDNPKGPSQAFAIKLARHAPHTTDDNLREWISERTRFDGTPLDTLTSMVQAIVKREARGF